MNLNFYLLQSVLKRAYFELISPEDEKVDRIYQLHDNQQRLDDELANSLFRFTYEQIRRIARAMNLPEVINFREESSHAFSWNPVDA